VQDVSARGLFYQSEFTLNICTVFTNFVREVYYCKDKRDRCYKNGIALIRHFSKSLIMKEIFERAWFSDVEISEGRRKEIEQEMLVGKS
jgi:hypothetical protein